MRTCKMLEAFNFQMAWRTWILVNWGLGKWMMMKMIKCKCYLTQICKMIQIKLAQMALMAMNKIKWLVHHLNPMIKQVQAMFQYSNQLILQGIIHWTLSLEVFSRGVQTRSRLASFCEHFSFVSSIEPKKIEEALKNIDWVNAMYEELNNFTRNQVW